MAGKVKSKKRAKKSTGRLVALLKFFCLLPILGLIAVAAIYFFGTVEQRTKIEGIGIDALQFIREADNTPPALANALANLEDSIPNPEAFVIDSEEAGRDGSHFVAGVPRGNQKMVLRQEADHSILTDVRGGTRLIAARIVSNQENDSYPRLWDGPIWKALIDEVAGRYPDRFEEVWLYSGPIYLNAKSSVAKAYFAIVFDLSSEGGLRALSFLIPNSASDPDLSNYLVSMATIQLETNLQFLPAVDYENRSKLAAWKSDHVW